MTSHIKKMMHSIKSAINDYIQTVSQKYNIPFDDLQQLMEIPAHHNNVVTAPPQQVVAQAVPLEGCKYIYLRGAKAGSHCTNKKKKDGEFCSQHSAKKKAAETTIVVNTNDVTVEAPKKPNPILRMNKIINKWWHPDSCLVFKSSEEKIVIGIYKNDTICDLSEEDVKTCIAYKFKYVMKRKRDEDNDEKLEKKDERPSIKKQKKLPAIDNEFVKVNQTAKNVEVFIKEMFTTKKEDDDEEEEEEDEEVVEEEEPQAAMIWSGGAEESKDNNNISDEELNEEGEEEVEEEEILFEEED